MTMRVLCCLFILCFSVPSYAGNGTRKPSQGAVVSAHPLATQAGYDVLEKGGNAFDAAVAVSSTLSVVEPYGSGLGGGGFWLLYEAKTGSYSVIDARETAPIKAHADMYLDEDWNIMKGGSTEGPYAAGIPGLPAAFAHVSETYGALPLSDVLKPSITHAKSGFPVGDRYVTGAKYKLELLRKYKSSAEIFLDNNEVPEKGWLLKQPHLGRLLEELAARGHDGFYKDPFARFIVHGVNAHGGVWTTQDLHDYQVKKRDAVVIRYKGAKIIAPPLPSSGGLVLRDIFKVLSAFDLKQHDEITRKHIIIEAMKRGYHSRVYMGDTDFSDVHFPRVSENIILDKAVPSAAISEQQEPDQKGTETTHFSVIDAQGNRVAVTQSINFWFGGGFVPQGTGVLLNNEMDDFVIKEGASNGYGLVGTSANMIEPKKRMLSSMTPTFVENDRGLLILGTPGGSRIISMNLHAVLAFIDGKSAEDIVSAPRYHHQFMPDVVTYEEGAFTDEELIELRKKGHVFKKSNRRYGNMQVIFWDYKTGKVHTGSDPRGEGAGRVY